MKLFFPPFKSQVKSAVSQERLKSPLQMTSLYFPNSSVTQVQAVLEHNIPHALLMSLKSF